MNNLRQTRTRRTRRCISTNIRPTKGTDSQPRSEGLYLKIGPFGEDVAALEMARSALGKQG
jgi:hypothetical protein